MVGFFLIGKVFCLELRFKKVWKCMSLKIDKWRGECEKLFLKDGIFDVILIAFQILFIFTLSKRE